MGKKKKENEWYWCTTAPSFGFPTSKLIGTCSNVEFINSKQCQKTKLTNKFVTYNTVNDGESKPLCSTELQGCAQVVALGVGAVIPQHPVARRTVPARVQPTVLTSVTPQLNDLKCHFPFPKFVYGMSCIPIFFRFFPTLIIFHSYTKNKNTSENDDSLSLHQVYEILILRVFFFLPV